MTPSLGGRRDMERTTRACRKTRSIQEDAGSIDQAGSEVSAGQLLDDALLSLLVELPDIGGESFGGSLDFACVLCPGEVGPVGAAALDQLRGRAGEDALATLSEDAHPRADQERHVELPGSLLVGVVEADPFVRVGRQMLVRC